MAAPMSKGPGRGDRCYTTIRDSTARDRSNMQPTIDALTPLHEAHPENPRVLYEIGGAYDTDGLEEIAAKFYEQASHMASTVTFCGVATCNTARLCELSAF